MKNLLFPLQDIDKNEVKNIAKDFDLIYLSKKRKHGYMFYRKKEFFKFYQEVYK